MQDRSRSSFRHTLATSAARLAVSLSCVAPLLALTAWADEDAKDAGKDKSANDRVLVLGEGVTAEELAPTQSSLAATEPQSIINADFIAHSQPTTIDFMAILQITPSAGGIVAGNGPGLGESKTTLRGFKDGEYNITFDGVPFGDTNNPTHHSTSFFPASDLGEIVVERGPGNADNLGQASFGGTVMLQSAALADKAGFSQAAHYGSWATQNWVTTGQSGGLLDNNAHAMVVLHEQKSDGYLSYAPIRGEDQMLKGDLKLLGGHLRLSSVVTHDWNTYYTPDATNGLTQARVDQVGKAYLFSNDPTRADYWAYALTRKQTWFAYVKAEYEINDKISVEDTPYYYFYTNRTLSTNDITYQTNGAPTTANLVTFSPTSSAKSFGIGGYRKFNQYNVYGNIAKAKADLGFGTLTAGLWSEYADTNRYLINQDVITGRPDYKNAAVAAAPSVAKNITYLQGSQWTQEQPYLEFEWRPLSNLTVTPGAKYVFFHRSVNAAVQQTSRLPTYFGHSWTTTLPYLTANYRLSDAWSVYGQYAKGFLAPDLNTTYVPNPTKSNFEPQLSTNYQLGTVLKTGHFTADADVYEVDFTNKVVSFSVGQLSPVTNLPLTDAQFFNIGGATYKGVEAQGAYAFGNGLAVFANGSKNDATDNATHLQIAGAPLWTAAGGVIYANGPWRASLTHKITGKSFSSAGEVNKILPLQTTGLNASYSVGNWSVDFGVNNLFDATNIASIAGSAPNFRYTFQAGRYIEVGGKLSF